MWQTYDHARECLRAGLSAPEACTREKSKGFVHESSAEGVYARFYSRAHAHCARKILFCASRMSAMRQEINRELQTESFRRFFSLH